MDLLHIAALSWKSRKWDFERFSVALAGLYHQGWSSKNLEHYICKCLEVTPKTLDAWLFRVSKDIELDLTFGAKHVHIGQAGYPCRLKRLKNPPLLLSYFGELEALEKRSFGIVGTRKPSPLTLSWMDRELEKIFLNSQVKGGWVVVSGGAYGVDLHAHSLALSMGVPSVVVLPSGIRKVSPKRCKELSEIIARRDGLVLSCFSPEQTAKGYLYHLRNEALVALSDQVLIGQAGARSGTMVSAKIAADLNTVVHVIPGHPTDIGFSGSLELIRDGANLTLEADDILSFMINPVSSGIESSMP